jgi:putative addiction module component (TIGR02574 family)
MAWEVVMTLHALIEEARRLPRHEQAELLDELICMVGVEEADVPLTPAQAADLDKRIDELEAGKAKLISGDEAIEMLRKRT